MLPLQGVLAQRVNRYPRPVKQYRVLVAGDTLQCIDLSDFTVVADIGPYLNRLNQIQAIVMYTLPYANRVAATYRNIESHNIDSLKKKDRKKILKAEKEKLYADMENIVRAMDVNDGRVFVKLIHRQCGVTAYDMITRYQGSAKAIMWQSLSRMGGANLKLTYQPYLPHVDDVIIDRILKKIEEGNMKMPEFKPYKNKRIN